MINVNQTWWKATKAITAGPEPILVVEVRGEKIVLANGSVEDICATSPLGTNFFPSYTEAREFIIARAERKVKVASACLTEALMKLEVARDLPEKRGK